MTNIMTLLAEAECWLGVEPLGEAQWAEVAELRERVAKALAPAPACRECMGSGVKTKGLLPGAMGVEQCRCVTASEKEPLPSAASSFLSDVAARRNADGIE